MAASFCFDLPVLRRVTFRSIEVVKVLGLDDVEAGIRQTLLESDDLRRRDDSSLACVGDKTASPVIDRERVR